MQVLLISKETVGNSCDILNVILDHRYDQNHSDWVIFSEWCQYLRQKCLWLQPVNGWVLTVHERLFCWRQHSGSIYGSSETRSRSNVWKEQDTSKIKLTFRVADFGFIHYLWPCLVDSDDIRDLKWRLKCPRNFRPPPWTKQLPIWRTKTSTQTSACSQQRMHQVIHVMEALTS